MAREDARRLRDAQFFINVADNARLDHVDVPPEGVTIRRRGQDVFFAQADANRVFGYAVFGRVVDGMDVVERIRHVPVHTVAGERNLRERAGRTGRHPKGGACCRPHH